MFGQRLKELRKSRGLTQSNLASIIGVEQSSIGKYEGKSHVIPSEDVRERIAAYFGVTVEYLMGKTNNPHPTAADSLSEAEAVLLARHRDLNVEGQQKLLEYADDLIASGKYIKETSSHIAEGA